jgi:hypothetical protein
MSINVLKPKNSSSAEIVWSTFLGEGTKLERFLAKNQHSQREFI